MPTSPVVVEYVRNDLVESRHHGSIVICNPDGSVRVALGDPGQEVFPRSSNKPMQAAAMVRNGLELPVDLLALAAASHSGTQRHRDGVLAILASAGLAESDLQNTPDFPLDPATMVEFVRAGGHKCSLAQNCSGKHAAMLATCVAAGWPTASYLDPGHPLQRAIRSEVEQTSGESIARVGIDGCGAPLFSISLAGLARAFGVMVRAESDDPRGRVVAAMQAHPELVGGPGRDVTAFMTEVPGMLAKDGAEGVYAAALADGTGIAFKIEDGNKRARPAVMVAILDSLGVDTTALRPFSHLPVLGHGEPVGELRIAEQAGNALKVQ